MIRALVVALSLLVSSVASAALPTGFATIAPTGGTCGGSVTTSSCRLATIVCPGVDRITASLKVTEPGSTATGTLVLFMGGGSSGAYESTTHGTAEVITPALAANRRVVQVLFAAGSGNGAWLGSPSSSSYGGDSLPDGPRALGCRYATVLRAIRDTTDLYPADASTRFEVSGQSGGGAGVAYALAWYGVGDFVDTAAISGGPPISLLQEGCMGDLDPAWAALCPTWKANAGGACTIASGSIGRGFLDTTWNDGRTSCELQRGGGPVDWRGVGLLGTGATRYFPRTRVVGIHGASAVGAEEAIGRYVLASWLAAGEQPRLVRPSGASHIIPDFANAAADVWKSFAGGTASDGTVLSASSPLHTASPSARTAALYISAGGQSNMAGSSMTPVLSLTQPYASVRWDRAQSDFDPLVEATNETPVSAMANYVAQFGGMNSVADNWAVGGQPYSTLEKGTATYTSMLSAMTAIGTARTNQPTKAVSVWVHGEADDNNGVAAATYAGYMVDLQADVEADALARFPSAGPIVPLIYSQVAAWPHYASVRYRSTSALGQLAAALANPTRIFMVGPNYHLPIQGGGLDVHHTNEGSRRLGEYLGKVVKRVVVDGQPWLPLHMASATAVGPTITITVAGGDGSDLAVDTSLMVERHMRGFEYVDDSGAPGVITGVAVSGRTITLTLDRDVAALGSNPRVRAGLTAPPAVAVGSTGIGPGTNVRDSDPSPSRSSSTPLRNWLAVQELAISSVTASGATRPAWGATQSLRFPSTSAYARNAEWAALDGATAATISFWLKRDSAPGNTFAVLAKNRASHRQFDIRVAPSSLTVYVATNLTTIVNASTNTNTLVWTGGPWHHVVVVFDGSQGTVADRVRVYIDGVSTALTTTPAWPTALTTGAAVELSVGASANRASALGSCNMRDIAMWRQAATPSQVTELFGAGDAIDPATTTLGAPVTHYPLNGTLADYGSGTLRHLAGFGGTTFQAVVP